MSGGAVSARFCAVIPVFSVPNNGSMTCARAAQRTYAASSFPARSAIASDAVSPGDSMP